jgi:hypothetical protein
VQVRFEGGAVNARTCADPSALPPGSCSQVSKDALCLVPSSPALMIANAFLPLSHTRPHPLSIPARFFMLVSVEGCSLPIAPQKPLHAQRSLCDSRSETWSYWVDYVFMSEFESSSSCSKPKVLPVSFGLLHHGKNLTCDHPGQCW